MADHEESKSASPEQSQVMTNRLVVLTSQLQRWSAAQTPLENDYHISFTQVSALYAIRYGADTPGAIAKKMQITPRAVTSHIDVLEEKGLLTRNIDPHDRRRSILTLTDEGAALSRDIEATALTTLSEYIHELDAEEYKAMQTSLEVLNRFLQSLDNPNG